jgi:hypothetical protein
VVHRHIQLVFTIPVRDDEHGPGRGNCRARANSFSLPRPGCRIAPPCAALLTNRRSANSTMPRIDSAPCRLPGIRLTLPGTTIGV